MIRKPLPLIALVSSITLCALWESTSIQDASPVVAAIPEQGATFSSRPVPLTKADVGNLRGATAVKRLYAQHDQLIWFSCINGSRNRNAVHDPAYCLLAGGWSIEAREEIAIPAGVARLLTFRRADESTQLLYWFSDGRSCYHSMTRYWAHTTLRRITLGHSGPEPVLILLRPHDSMDNRTVNWNRLVTSLCP